MKLFFKSFLLIFIIHLSCNEEEPNPLDLEMDIEISTTSNGVLMTTHLSGTALTTAQIVQHGYCWTTDGSVPKFSTAGTNQIELGTFNGDVTFSEELSNLVEGETYNFRSYIIRTDASNSNGDFDFYSQIKEFIVSENTNNGGTDTIEGAWTQMPIPVEPNAMYKACSFKIGNNLYIGAGHESFGQSAVFWSVDIENNIWNKVKDYGGSYNGQIHSEDIPLGLSVNDKGYVYNGNSFYSFSHLPDSGTWYNLPNISDAHAGFVLNSRIFCLSILGSWGDTKLYEYQINNNIWIDKIGIPFQEKYNYHGFSLNNKGYILGGYVNGNGYLKEFHEYDVVLNLWTAKKDFQGIARYGGVGFELNGKYYYGLGKDNQGNYLGDFWEYNPTTDSWRQVKSITDFGGNRKSYATGFSVNGKGYIAFGMDEVNGYSKEVWQFTID